uniref:Peptidase aspartic putative domain-containing protein n=1 Tax=Plectus sambesii TaxID=2011161 RepID=A0A914UNU3_9BILA
MEVLDSVILKLEHEISVIKEAVETLQGCNKDWGDMMERLPVKKKEAEEKVYEDYSSGENSIFKIIANGTSIVKIFEARIREAERLQLRLWNPQQIGMKREPITTESTMTDQAAGQQGSTSEWVNLPKLELPTYDGDPLKWSGFWDTFEATVNTQEISPIQKLNYLMSKLTGAAFEALDGITRSNDNYEIAVELLKERFGQARQIKQALYAQLRNIPKASEKTEELRRTLTGVDRVARQLKAMGEDLNQDSLITQFLEKLPDDIVLEVGKGKHRNEAWQMDQLRAALEDIVCNREDLLRIKIYSKSEDEKMAQSFLPNRSRNVPTNVFGVLICEEESNEKDGTLQIEHKAKMNKQKPPIHKDKQMLDSLAETIITALATEIKRNVNLTEKRGTRYPCVFCGENHFNDQCKMYRTREARQEKIMEKKLCFRCLRQRHMAKDCRTTRPCHYCDGNHHRALCARYLQPAINSPPPERATMRPQSTMDTEDATLNKPIGVHTMTEETKYEDYEEMEENMGMKTSIIEEGKWQAARMQQEAVLLTAKTEVSNPDERDKARVVHIFFDCGSERSFITQRLAKKLKLKAQSEETLSVYTFASKEPQKLKAPLVQVGITLKDGTKKIIEASALEMLTNKLQRKALKQEDLQIFKQISSDDFANDLPSKYEAIAPDILIGSDYFWEFMEPKEMTKCPSGLYLISSKVGLLMGGNQGREKRGENVKISTQVTSTNERRNFNQYDKKANPSLAKMNKFGCLQSTGMNDSPELSDGGARLNVIMTAVGLQKIREDATNVKEETFTKIKKNVKIAEKKKVSNLFSIMNALLIFLCLFLIGAKGSSCPENENPNRILSQQCIKEGIGVMRTEGYLTPGSDSRQKLLQVWKKNFKNTDRFWELWYDEYLLSLRKRMTNNHKGPGVHEGAPIKSEESVSIKEETLRGVWRMEEIIELKEGRSQETDLLIKMTYDTQENEEIRKRQRHVIEETSCSTPEKEIKNEDQGRLSQDNLIISVVVLHFQSLLN